MRKAQESPGPHVGCECCFCVKGTRVFTTYRVGKECFRQLVVTSWDSDWRSILTHDDVVCGELRHTARTRPMELATFALGTYAVATPASTWLSIGVACCSTSVSLGGIGTVPGVASCASESPADSCSKPLSILVQPVPATLCADVSALQPVRTTSAFELDLKAGHFVEECST